MKTPLDIMPEVMAANHRALLQLHASDSGLESQLAWEQLLRSLTSRYEDYIDQTLSKQDQFALANILENQLRVRYLVQGDKYPKEIRH
jgi:hypothetical protein|tara:strand:- start:459 stop:722 length:264 start_codon:yes stop_codon:yes gene_type:complete